MNIGFLREGLTIMAECRERTGDIWHAHYGAAAIAGYFFAKDNPVDGETKEEIGRQIGKMLEAHRFRSESSEGKEAGASGGMFGPEEAESLLLEALGPTMDDLHWVGHNVIYAALSLKAIRESAGRATERDVLGIAGLLKAFAGTIPGRSWIGFKASEARRLEVDRSLSSAVADPATLSRLVLDELAAFRTIYRAEAHHDLIGHLLTFSQALNLLFDIGRDSLFRKGLPSLFRLVQVLRATRNIDREGSGLRLVSPVDRYPLVPAFRSAHLPIEAEYWRRASGGDWDFGHAFKFPYAFYDHARRAGDDIVSATENFRYLLPCGSVPGD